MIGCKYLFRGAIVKEWAKVNQSRINFYQYNKVLVKICVQYYHEFRKRKYAVLYKPETQMKVLKDDVLSIMEEKSKEEVKGLKRYVEVHTIDVNNASVDDMLLWMRSVRAFKSIDRKSRCQDMRIIINARVT